MIQKRSRLLAPLALVVTLGIFSAGYAADLLPLITDTTAPATGATAVVDELFLFADGPAYGVDDTGVEGMNNQISVYSLQGAFPGGSGGGMGFSLGVSNGENGIDSTELGENIDVPNMVPVNSAIAAINGGGRIQDGNAFRFSAWMRQDPNAPITAEPSIQPVLKIELWKEANSTNAFTDAPADNAPWGDRIWDTDQNGGTTTNELFGQSQASWVDINNTGTTSFGKPVAQSLVSNEWRLVETTLVVDEDPLDSGGTWMIGDDPMTVNDIEEVRGVLYSGDWAQTDLTDGGSIWLDNVLFEVFADEATMLATPNANPLPTDTAGLVCDADGDGGCDATDINMLYQAFGTSGALDLDGSGTIDADDIDEWLGAASDVSNPAKGDAAHTYVLGDVNFDGSVNSIDLGLLLNNFGDTTGLFYGDGNVNGDANVDSIDLGQLLNNFNFASSSLAANAVPEPGTMGISIVALLGLFAIRRRR